MLQKRKPSDSFKLTTGKSIDQNFPPSTWSFSKRAHRWWLIRCNFCLIARNKSFEMFLHWTTESIFLSSQKTAQSSTMSTSTGGIQVFSQSSQRIKILNWISLSESISWPISIRSINIIMKLPSPGGASLLHVACWTGNLELFRAFCLDANVWFLFLTLDSSCAKIRAIS